MSKHNRERRAIWRAYLHKQQIGRKLSQQELNQALNAARATLTKKPPVQR